MAATGGILPLESEYLTPHELGALMKKSVSWVQKKAAAGQIPCRRIGRDLRFPRTEIDKWLAAQPKARPRHRRPGPKPKPQAKRRRG